MAQSELDKLLKAFEDKNTSMEYYILMSVDGIPFKSNIEKNSEVVRISGLIFDLILYSKKILEDLTFEYKGVYDPMIKTGYVLITKEDIKNKNIQIKLDML